MGLILKFLGGPLGLYALIAVGASLAGLTAYGYVQHANAARYQVERDQARTQVKGLVVAVESKDKLIADLTTALQTWQKRATESKVASDAAGDRAQQYQSQLSAARTKIHALSESDRALPDCSKLLAVDLAAVCPGNALRMREWTKRGLQGPSGGSANPGSPTG